MYSIPKSFLRASLRRKRYSAAICDLVIDSKSMVRGKIKVSPRTSLMVNNFSPLFSLVESYGKSWYTKFNLEPTLEGKGPSQP